MSDAELRDLERRFADTGTLSDEVELLRARLRADTLTPEQLHIAALAEHPAAIAVAKEVPLVRPLKEIAAVFKRKPAEIESWFEIGCPRTPKGKGFTYDLAQVVRWRNAWGPEEGPNVGSSFDEAFVASQASEAALRAMCALDPEVASRAVIASIRRDHLQAGESEELPSEVVSNPSHLAVMSYFEDLLILNSQMAHHRLRYAGGHRPHTTPGILLSVLEAKKPQTKVKRLFKLINFDWSESSWLGEVPPAVVRAAINAEIVPWALGYRDPVRERVAGREQLRREARTTTEVRTAAVGGEVASMIELAARLAEGKGVDVDVPQAGRWLKRAIQEGTPEEAEAARAARDALSS